MTLIKFIGIAALAAAPQLLLPAEAFAQPQPEQATPSDFEKQSNALLQAAYPADGPGAAAIVTRGGRVIYSGGRGLADVEAARPLTTDAVFRLGSITKQFTAAVILQLAAEGKLSLDDPIARFFPDWPQPAASATVRQLLNHTSGLQDFSKIPGWIAKNRMRSMTTAELLDVFRHLPAKAPPGQEWEYNNGGYVMLGAIVEKVTGKPWYDAVAERIARPLGLHSLAGGETATITAADARGYTEKERRQQPATLSNLSIPHAAGGLVASVGDMAKWAQALHHGRVVSPALYKEMTNPARLADGSTEPYGFGLRLRQIRGRVALAHGGAISGFDTASAYVPSGDLFVAVFANSDDPVSDPSTLVQRLAALALGQPIPSFAAAEVAISEIEPLFGSYAAKDGPPRRFFSRGGKLYVARGDGQLEAFAAGGDRFFFGPEQLTWISFARKPDGAHVMEVHSPDTAQAEQAVRTGPVPPPLTLAAEVMQSYVGVYATEGPVMAVAMTDSGGLTIQPKGGPVLPMRPVSETEFMVDAARSRVVFHPENGKVDRLTIHRGARELHGKRTDG